MEIYPENNSVVKLNIICVAYERPIPLRILIDSFMVQTNPFWSLRIIHDGPASEKIKQIMALPEYKDNRIRFTETPKRSGKWGHPNRQLGLGELAYSHRDFVLITNDDNYYVPEFVDQMLQAAKNQVGMVYCDTVHNYLKYAVLSSELKVDRIDMGSFIVRVDIAKKVGFINMEMNADGYYAVRCAAYCKKMNLKIKAIRRPIFVHN